MIKRFGALVFALTLLFAFAVPASADNPEGVPVGYTSYEYIESDGSIFLDTDFRPNQNTGFFLDFEVKSNSNAGTVLGSRAQTGDYYVFQVSFTDTRNMMVQINQTPVYFTVDDVFSRHQIEVGSGTMTLDGSSQSYSATSFQSLYPLYLFARNQWGTAAQFVKCRVYSFKVYDNLELVRDYVPVSNPLGEYGFWDRSNDSFYPVSGSGSASVGGVTGSGTPAEDSVADVITDLNTQIHDIESAIYDDLHTYSAQVDPSTATNFSGNFLSAMSFISNTWTSAYNQLGDMQVIITFPLFLAIAMLFIGRMNSVIASGAMKSRKNNDKKGGGDVG